MLLNWLCLPILWDHSVREPEWIREFDSMVQIDGLSLLES